MPQTLTEKFRQHYSVLLLGLIIVFYLINGICYLRQQSLTSDEGSFMSYAIRYVKGHPERTYPRTDNSKMPVSAINLLPRAIEKVLTGVNSKDDGGLSDTMHGRYVTLFFSIFTILLVFQWARELYGKNAGLFAAFLMSFCPNSISNAALVTTDSYSVLFLLLSFYLLWKYARNGGLKWFVMLSLPIALSQLVKQSLFHLYILTPLCLIIYYLNTSSSFDWKVIIKKTILFIIINIVILNAAYFFNGSFQSLGDYNFMSNLFNGLQNSLPGWLPIPFPRPFIDGLDMAKYYDQVGGGFDHLSSFGKPTILGEARTGGSFWYYYLVSIFYKTPIAYLLLFGWASSLMWLNSRVQKFIRNEFFIFAPVIYFIFVMSFFYKTQCGIRHIIFIYPFLFIFSASIIPGIKRRYEKILLALLSLYLVVSVLLYWRNYYPYTNEFVYDKKDAYLKVGASNLEFQQGYFFAENYIRNHKDVAFAPKDPAVGRFLIRSDDYLDIWNRHEYDWISHIKPKRQVAYSYLLIEVSESDLKTTK